MSQVKLAPLTVAEWRRLGESLFGPDRMTWRFVCPACGHTAAVQDWKDAGAPEASVAFSCVGCWKGQKRKWLGGKGPGPCDYAGGGLFRINPQTVVDDQGNNRHVFAFAPAAEGGAK